MVGVQAWAAAAEISLRLFIFFAATRMGTTGSSSTWILTGFPEQSLAELAYP